MKQLRRLLRPCLRRARRTWRPPAALLLLVLHSAVAQAATEAPRTFDAVGSDDSSLTFLDDRFRATVTWRLANGAIGSGHAVPFTDRAGLFWFFHADNLEMLVKMLDGCSLNDHFWVFFAATTNVAFTVTVVDTFTGDRRQYSNDLGHAADPVLDTAAFATCDAPESRPRASFTSSCRGFRCQFTDTSEPPSGSLFLDHCWDFGDGTDSTASDPLHQYLTAGSYSVQLEVESSRGAKDSTVRQVDVTCISSFSCCNVCTTGRACGDSCISSSFSCSKGIGCACDAREVC